MGKGSNKGPPPARKARPRTGEFTIARALTSFGGEDEARLCAFLEVSETHRKEGLIDGWTITHDNDGWHLAYLFLNGLAAPDVMQSTNVSLDVCMHELSEQLVAAAMQGAGVG